MSRVHSYEGFNRREGKGPKGKDPYLFVRFGGLSIKDQVGYSSSSKSFHSPPAPRGIYAFPKSCQEMFLVGSIGEFQPGTMPKEPKWNKLSDEDYEKTQREYERKRKESFRNLRKEFRKTDGYIWHHLTEFCKPHEVVSRHGTWIKTNIQSWVKAFMKSSLNDRYGNFNAPGEESLKRNTINNTRGISGMHSKDHYEVFFDEKI